MSLKAIIVCIFLCWGFAILEAEDGAGIFKEKCAACHLQNGEGAPGLYPPLAASLGNYLKVENGRAYLVHSVSYGLQGPMQVNDVLYDGVMPRFSRLRDQEIAEVINYVLNEFNKDILPKNFQCLTPDEVKKYRADDRSPTDVYNERKALMERLTKARSKSDAIPEIKGEAELYARGCQGCHLANGKGLPNTVPPLLNFVGYFAHIPEGRAYLVQVPGVAQASLSDSDIAALLNWMLIRFSANQLPKRFTPLTTDEVKRYRANKLFAVRETRETLIDTLRKEGIFDRESQLVPSGKGICR
jgi:mono/diheme cytochrome c family protein